MTVEDIIQQQAKKNQQTETLPIQAVEEDTLNRIHSSNEDSLQDPVYKFLHQQGKVRLGGITIESFKEI